MAILGLKLDNLLHQAPLSKSSIVEMQGLEMHTQEGRKLDVRTELLFEELRFKMGANSGLNLNFEVLNYLDHITAIFAGEFRETTENPHFSKIARFFWKALFRYPCIYIGVDEALVELERSKLPKYKHLTEHDIEPDSNIRIYTRVGSGESTTYTSVISGITNLKINDPTMIIKTQWDAYGTHRFLSWWILADTVVKHEGNFNDLVSVATKKIKRMVTNEHTQTAENAKFYSRNVILDVSDSITNSNTYTPVEFMPMVDLQVYLDTFISWFTYKSNMLGLTTNKSEKTERLTKGENFKDMKVVTNRTQNTLNELKVFAERMAEWGVELAFETTSSPDGDGNMADDEDKEEYESTDNGI